MPKFTVAFHKTVVLTRTVEAEDLDGAIVAAYAVKGWDDCKEVTLGTAGVQEVYDEHGRLIYQVDECTCDEVSWFGDGHSTSCPHLGIVDEDDEYTEDAEEEEDE